VKRTQALLASNLPGIAEPTKTVVWVRRMREAAEPSLVLMVFVVMPLKTHSAGCRRHEESIQRRTSLDS